MNYKRIGRALMCLVLICCLMVQTVPRADATGAGLAATITGVSSVAVSAPVAVGAMAIALGVMAGTNDDFQHLVTTAASSGFEWVKDGTVELLRTVDALGNQAFYVAGEFLEDLRSSFFDSDILKFATSASQYLTLNGESFLFSGTAPFLAVRYDCDNLGFYAFISSSACTITYGGNSIRLSKGQTYHPTGYDYYNGYYVAEYSGAHVKTGDYSGFIYLGDLTSYMDSIGYSNGHCLRIVCTNYIPGLSSSVSSPYDLSLGHISTVPIDGTSALDWAPEYQANRLKVIEGGNDPDPDSDPPNDGKWFWPLALTATTAELLLMSQADQWSGESSPEFGDYTTGTEFEIVSRPEFEGDQQLELAPLTNPEPGTGTNPDPDPDVGGDTGDTPDYTSWFTRIIDLIEELLERFKTWVSDCKIAIEELPSKFAKWFDNICETLGNIWEWCQNLVQAILNGLAELLAYLFAPASDFIANKVNSLVSKYPYLDTFSGFGTDLKAFFITLGAKPPIIYIDLGAATGSYVFGGRQAFIDLSWYADYKPTMDAILGAFIWLWLAWRVFHALPGIINGMSGTVGERVSYSGTQNINLPPLPPQNELPPGHNRRM